MIEAGLLWLEEYLSCSESLTSDEDLSTIRQLVVLLASVTLLSILLGSLVVIDDQAHFLLNILDDLNFRIGRKTIASIVQDLLEVFCDVATGQVNPLNCVGDGVALVYWHSVRNTVTGVEDDTSSSTIRIECQNRLNTHVEARHVEYFEHYLGHFLPVFFWIKWCLGHENRMLLRGDFQFTIEGMMPNLFHVIPICNNSVINWMTESEHAPLLHSLFADVDLVLVQTDHNTGYLGATHNR